MERSGRPSTFHELLFSFVGAFAFALKLTFEVLDMTSRRHANMHWGTKCFTKYGDIRIEQYVKAYGTIQDLKRLIQLARQASVYAHVPSELNHAICSCRS
ncbi:unnamed protein product [Anisakis simplex]|uniref:MLO-like protein n=1 Tax=Anisakis simplex TaxID=6269 RepID=A0A0M3J405_ANISI|nr:unnamed protein product [Anisakis simplex]